MSAIHNLVPIRVGVVANEPMRLEGLISIFDSYPKVGELPLVPIVGTLEEHLADQSIEYLVIDWSSSTKRLGVLEGLRRKRPNLRMVVIGPIGNEDTVLETIIAGARAYLDLGAGPRMVERHSRLSSRGQSGPPASCSRSLSTGCFRERMQA